MKQKSIPVRQEKPKPGARNGGMSGTYGPGMLSYPRHHGYQKPVPVTASLRGVVPSSVTDPV